ncbi:sulfatase, partial [Candidatus Aminicenantes bacterium AC-335-B20]|nr:sulfatase [Candidatus Aminicenantes bacterium AC-335-B20]
MKKKLYVIFLIFIFTCNCSKLTKTNLILITLDTQRADFISAYSPKNSNTPNIDWLAKNGILFENCYSLIPITLPSHATIFYSKQPWKLNIFNNGEIFKSKNKISLAGFFKKRGYITGAFISLGVLTSKYGLRNGFDYYYDKFPKTRWYLNAREINVRVINWLKKNSNKKFFLWIHYSDPHEPYAPPYLPPNFRVYFNNKILHEIYLKSSTVYYLKFKLKKGINSLKFETLSNFPEIENKYLMKITTLEFNNFPNLKINFEKGWLIEKREKIIYFLKKEAIIKLINNSNEEREIELKIEGEPLLPLSEKRNLYRRETEYMDGEIGKLLEKLKDLNLLNKTHIILVGDHGEGLGEYKTAWGGPHFGHIHFLYSIYLKVPFIIYNPHSSRNGVRISEIVSLLDVAPTILEGI